MSSSVCSVKRTPHICLFTSITAIAIALRYFKYSDTQNSFQEAYFTGMMMNSKSRTAVSCHGKSLHLINTPGIVQAELCLKRIK